MKITKEVKIPNLFIVGAPKCGTSALYDYLRQHPETFMPFRKEYYFFGSDLGMSRLSAAEYFAYFQPAKDEKIIGEGSTWYLYSTRAAQEIRQISPDAKIIIMLRNPVEMLYSLHSQLLFTTEEDEPDFKRAMELEFERRAGKHLPARTRLPAACFYYRDVADFFPQVKRYLDVFGRDRVKIILFEDFKKHTREIYTDTLNFLEIDPNFTPDFKIVNANKRVRSSKLMSIIRHPPHIIQKMLRRLLPSEFKDRLVATLWSMNAQYISRKPMDFDLRLQLINEFTPGIRKLEALIDVDLSGWYSSS
jgi:hypothetical protein